MELLLLEARHELCSSTHPSTLGFITQGANGPVAAGTHIHPAASTPSSLHAK